MSRGERRHRTERKVERRMRGVDWDTPRGRARKTSPYDCGNPRCFCCHYRKILDLPRPSDTRREEPAHA